MHIRTFLLALAGVQPLIVAWIYWKHIVEHTFYVYTMTASMCTAGALILIAAELLEKQLRAEKRNRLQG